MWILLQQQIPNLIMHRRQFLSATLAGGGLLFAGCSSIRGTTEVPTEGDLWVRNITEIDRRIDVVIRDDDQETVFSTELELSPDDTDDDLERVIAIVDLGATYFVEASADEHRGEYEWDAAVSRGILYIFIEEDDIPFAVDAFEG